MPYKDPEVARAKGREYSRASRERNRDKKNARVRELRAQDPDKYNEYQRTYRARNIGKVRARGRLGSAAHYAENREQVIERQREYRVRNADEVRARDRLRKSGEKMRTWRMHFKHGLRPEDWAALWQAQGGCCYLCGEEMTADKAIVEHDHRHCPPEQSCHICRRGLACANCNASIGMAGDDPARLRRLADALETAQLEVDRRRTAADAVEQLLLIE